MKKIISNTFICCMGLCWSLAVAGGFSAPPSLTQSIADARYAKLMGLSTQAFSVANAIGAQNALPLGQADARYMAIGQLASPPAIGNTTPNTGKFTTLNATASTSLNGVMVSSATAPFISSGFGTSPSIVGSNGTATFRINVGTGGTASSGVIGMPTAPNGWNCLFAHVLNSSINLIDELTASTTTSVTVTSVNNVSSSVAWSSGAIVIAQCTAY